MPTVQSVNILQAGKLLGSAQLPALLFCCHSGSNHDAKADLITCNFFILSIKSELKNRVWWKPSILKTSLTLITGI